ncbi:hypothetical protein J6590_102705, partial [Homalodisca vitripennis]
GKHDATALRDEAADHIKQRYGNEGLRHLAACVSTNVAYVGGTLMSPTCSFLLGVTVNPSCTVVSSRHDQAKPLVNLLVCLFFLRKHTVFVPLRILQYCTDYESPTSEEETSLDSKSHRMNDNSTIVGLLTYLPAQRI